jgi:hypothetical protein
MDQKRKKPIRRPARAKNPPDDREIFLRLYAGLRKELIVTQRLLADLGKTALLAHDLRERIARLERLTDAAPWTSDAAPRASTGDTPPGQAQSPAPAAVLPGSTPRWPVPPPSPPPPGT